MKMSRVQRAFTPWTASVLQDQGDGDINQDQDS
jgi:hypothetical protein